MYRSVSVRRWPALMFATVAMFGLLLRPLPPPAVPTGAPFPWLSAPVCHAADDGPRQPDRPGADCDACPLCVAVYFGIPILGAVGDLPAVSAAGFDHPLPPPGASPRQAETSGPWARAPPVIG